MVSLEIINEGKSLKAEEILEIAKCLKIKSQKSEGIFGALKSIVENNKNSAKPVRIIVCGSLYLAGNFLEENQKGKMKFKL